MTLLRITRCIEHLNKILGRTLACCIVLMALVTFGIVIFRSFFHTGSIAVQETVMYMHAALFLVSLAYVAQRDGHVRVDVFYREMDAQKKHWVNAIGAIIFLFPFSVFITVTGWEFAAESWAIKEGSSNPGGLPLVYLLKSLIPLAGGLLVVRALTEALKETLHITYCIDDNPAEEDDLARWNH